MRFRPEAIAVSALLACAPAAGVGAAAASVTALAAAPAAPGAPVAPMASAAPTAPAAISPTAAAAPIGADEVRAAAAKLRTDPSLGHEKKIRSLRWAAGAAARPPQRPISWLAGLFDYLGQTASLLLWVAGAIAVAGAVIWVYRTFKARAGEPAASAAPSLEQIGAVDIRPDSLPEDIGAAALVLAEAGKAREALSLLYRGALSRAVHRFGIPIGESFTEGEALSAVGARLDAERTAYFRDLVGLWRRVVYGGEAVPHEPVGRLCRGFVQALDTAAP